MTPIEYRIGDATRPGGSSADVKIIAHICNDVGAWGAGFVVALSKRWTFPGAAYCRAFYTQEAVDPGTPVLGDVQYVKIPREYTVGEGQIVVANMIAQHGIGWREGRPPIRYDALQKCLDDVGEKAKASQKSVTVHMPRIGTGLAGGTWDKIEPIIQWALVRRGVPVTIYDLPKGRRP